MSQLDDNLKWIKQYRSGKLWLTKLKSKYTIQQYLNDLRKYCDATNKTPDEILNLKLEGQRAAGTPAEFQAEELHDIAISEMDTTNSVKANVSTSVQSFYKHNRRPLVQVKVFDRPSPKQRTPSLQDIQEMASVASNHRDKFIVWLLTTAPFREGTVSKLRWGDLKETGDKDLPYALNIEAERLKGRGRGKYKGLKQICFINYFVAEKLANYRRELERKGFKITDESPLILSYISNGNGGKKGTTISGYRLHGLFTQLSLDSWHDLEQKRFSPHDYRSFVNTQMERAKITETWRSVVLGHKPRGVKSYYSDPSINELKEHFKLALPYLIPEHRQRTPETALKQKLEDYSLAAWEFVRQQLEATVKESQLLREWLHQTKNKETRKLIELQLTMKLEEIQRMKQALKQMGITP